MAALLKLLTLSLLLCLVVHGMGQQCSLANIKVNQSKTGNLVKGQPEYQVVISNDCICTQSNLKLNCPGGFSTVEPVDPKILAVESDGTCLINDGQPISKDSPITFKYAWLTPTDLPPVSSTVKCS